VRCIGAIARAGVLGLAAYVSNALVQAAQSNTESSPVGVDVSVAPIAGTEQSPVSFKLQVSISNSTNHILVESFPNNEGAVQIEVHDEAGATLPETVLGCKLNVSAKCGPSDRPHGRFSSMTDVVVMPGQTISFERDLSKEFDLTSGHSVVIEVIASDFALVDAPKSVAGAPPPLRRGYLVAYQQYPHTRLAPFRSKAVRLQIEH
jgi:hypothetical protein